MPNVPNVPGVPALPGYSGASVPLLTADAVLQSVVQSLSWGIYFNGVPVIIPANSAISPLVSAASSALAPFAEIAGLLGLPNLLPVVASTIEFDFSQEWAIATYPVEGGQFQSYDKVQMPFECRVQLASGGAPSQRQAFINSILAIAGGSPLGASSLLSTILSPITQNISQALNGLASTLTGGILSGAISPPLFDLQTPEGTFTSCSVRGIGFSRRAYQGATLIVADLTFQQVRQTSIASFTSTLIPDAASQQGIGVVQPTDLSQNAPGSGNINPGISIWSNVS